MEVEIAARIRDLREIAELSLNDAAKGIGIDAGLLEQYENGEKDVPMGELSDIAKFYGVEMTDLLSGGGPMLHTFSFVKNGRGISVERGHNRYKYQHLAYNFAGRIAEPFLVTVDSAPDEEIHLNRHEGQEFNYCVEGKLLIVVDGQECVMEPGDSLYFDSMAPHGMKSLDGNPAKFLAILL